MNSLWTPDGEHKVSSAKNSSEIDTDTTQPAMQREYDPGQEPTEQEYAQMQEEISQIALELTSVPASSVLANHLVGLFQLAVAHLGVTPPHLDDARLAVDAFGLIVDGMKGRLGADEDILIDALAQCRLMFVEMSNLSQQE